MTAGFDFYINIENSAGVVQGDGPITSAPGWTYTARMDRAGSFSFRMPATDPKAALVQKKRVARAFALLGSTWVEVGAGIIDDIQMTPGEDESTWLTVGGDDLLRELTYRSVLDLKIYLNNAPISHSAALQAVGAFAPSGWSFTPDSSPPNSLLYGRFNGHNVLAALIKIAEKTQNHFYRGTGRSVVFASSFSASGVRAIRADGGDLAPETAAIKSLTQQIQTYDLITRIYPRGSGNGDVQLTLRATTRTAPTGFVLNKAQNYIESTAAAATYGRIEQQVDFREIGPIENTTADIQAAANMLFDAALEELRRRSTELEQATYTISLDQCSALLRPMQSIFVDYSDPDAGLTVRQTLNILEATWSVDESGVQTTGLVVSNADRWPDSDAGTVVDSIEQAFLYQALPQLNANSYTTGYRFNLDSQEVGQISFDFGPEVVQLQRVSLKFRLLRFESTVKSVSGESGTSSEAAQSVGASSTVTTHSHTVTIPGHSHTVTVAGHSHTVTISGHSHTVTISGHNHTVTVPAHNHTVTVPSHNHTVTIGGHSHTVTIPGHQHGVPNHQHTLNLAKSSGGFTVRAAISGSLALLQYDGGGGDPDTVGARTTPDSGATTSDSGGSSTQTSSTTSQTTPTTSSADSTQDTSSTASSTQDTSSTTSQQTPTTSTTSQTTPTSNTISDQTPTSSTLAQTTPTTSTTSQATPTSNTTSDQTPTSNTTSEQTPTSSGGGSHSHTVTIPAHSHTVLPLISMVYGIFREDSAKTYGIDDLEYRVNSGSWVALNTATSQGGGWFSLDITDSVMDADTFRPLQTNNTLEIRSTIGDEIVEISGETPLIMIDTIPAGDPAQVGDLIVVSGTVHFDGIYRVFIVDLEYNPGHVVYVVQTTAEVSAVETTGFIEILKTVTVDALLSVRNIIQSVALT